MARHLGAHLCRCTGYVKVLDAIEAVAKGEVCTPALLRRHRRTAARSTRPPSWRSATAATSTTSACRACSMPRSASPPMPGPRSPRIDTGAALAAPGVVAVFTAADIPGELRVGIIYKDWPVMIPVGGRTSYAGDVLAIVVAETRQQARAAAALGRGRLRGADAAHRPRRRDRRSPRSPCGAPTRTCCQRRAPTSVATSTPRSPAAPTSSPRRSRPSASSTPSSSRSPRSPCPASRRRAFAARVFRRPGRVGRPRPDRRRCSASPTDSVTVELVSNGGAFGGKEDMSNQAQTALAAWLLDRPVMCTLSREESLLIHPKRHPHRGWQ